MFSVLLPLLLILRLPSCAADISTTSIPPTGNASVTHYDLPLGGYVASCGCGGNSSYYPTAAISQAAYGSTISAGPACGQCFNVSLVSAFIATPPFVLDAEVRPWVVVKITDKCPAPPIYDPDRTWCGATASQMNHGVSIHFDLASASPLIPLSFFPTPPPLYGYNDFGSWRATYASISCEFWAGYRNDTASIVDPSLGTLNAIGNTGCCPRNPLFENSTCKATSLVVGSASRASLSWIMTLAAGIISLGLV